MTIRFSSLGLIACAASVLFAATVNAQTRFDPLFRLANIKGVCLVRTPDSTAFVPAVNRKAYPYDTAVQLGADAEAVILFSPENSIQLTGPAEATVAIQTGNPEGRVLRLASGEARTFTDDALPETAMIVETPVAACDAFTGKATIKVSRDVDATLVLQVEAAVGGTRITGPQFMIAKLKSACSIQIRSTPDRSLTRLVNTSGDYPISLENGTDAPVQFESTSKSSVKIWREYAPVGGRLIVSVFAIGPEGKGRECYAFAVGQPAVASKGMPVSAADIAAAVSNAVTPAAATATPPVSGTPAPAPDPNSIF